MTIQTLIESLRRQNVQLGVDGERLRCNGPKAVLTAEVREELAKHKAEIIAYLTRPAAQSEVGATPAAVPASNPYQLPETKASGALNAQQRDYLQHFAERYIQRTRKSKQWMQKCRPVLADYDSSAGFRRDLKELHYLLVSDHAQGARIWDLDGNAYIDFCMGFGVNLFGHVPAFESAAIAEELQRGMALGPHWHLVDQVAELLCEFTGLERVTFVNSGTEAVMAALRIARAATGRSKIAFFAGSYHGTSDGLLVVRYLKPNGELSALPMVPGVTRHMAGDVLVLDYDNPESLKIIQAQAHELAAVLVEPVQSRKPDLQPKEFLQALRQITTEADIALIFDEMITGFRIHPGGAQAWFGIQADIATYGKIIGGGMPIGVVAGKAKYMDVVDGGMWSYGDNSGPHVETTFITGTFSRHPLSMAAVLALLKELKRAGPALQDQLNQRTINLVQRLNDFFKKSQAPIQVVSFGSLFRFTSSEDLSLFYYHLADKGIYIGVNHNCFLSPVHSDDDLEQLVRAVKDSVGDLQRNGFLPCAPEFTASLAEAVVATEAYQLPLTEIQQDYWLATHLGSETARAAVEGMYLRLRGPLNVDALRRALQTVVDRHEALRATFDAQGTYQSIVPQLSLEVPVIDLSQFENSEREAQAKCWIANQNQQPFDLMNGPLFRCQILKLGEQEHLLCPDVHHLVMDGWSFELLFKELVELYPGESEGKPASLPKPLSYATYVAWQEQLRTSPQRAAAEAFWRAQFAGELPVVDLPTDRIRPKTLTYGGGREHTVLAAEVLERLKKWSGQHGATFFMTLLTAFAAFLKRITGQDDLVIGIPVALRSLRGSDNLIGYCTNILPIRIRLAGDPRFSEALATVRRTLVECYTHADYPFGALIRALNPKRDLSRLPLVAITFNLDRRVALPSLAGVDYELVPQPVNSTQYDFGVDILEANGAFEVDGFYRTDLFEQGTIQRWLVGLECLLRGVMEQPETRISALPLLPAIEQRKLLIEWNATQVDYPHNFCVHELFEAQVERTPNAPAVTSGRETLTYRQLNSQANQLAHYLRELGVGPDVRVGICLERSVEMLVALLAVLKAGGAYLPLDPALPAERLAWMIRDAQLPLVLTQHPLNTQILPDTVQTVLLDDAKPAGLMPATAENLPQLAHPEHLAYVIYTSGSTGQPKGVMVSHQALAHYALAAIDHFGFTAQDRVLQFASLSFDAAAEEIYPPLLCGARLVLRTDAMLNTVETFLQACAADKITVLDLPTAYWHVLTTELEASSPALPSSWRLVIIGGEAALADRVTAWFRQAAPAIRLVNTYGPTETTIVATRYEVNPSVLATGNSSVPIGRPIANTQIYLLDDHFWPVPIGVRGEIYIAGRGVARGYWDRPELTAERFIPNPFSAELGGRLYRTGDLARYRPDGTLEFVGRVDHQVKIRGFRIELEEIEVLLNQHPAVRQAVVLAKEGEPISDSRRLVAFLVASGEPELSLDDLRGFLKKQLPDYMVPSAFILVEEIPLNAHGKVDRRALAALEMTPVGSKTFVAPQTPTEQTIAEIWREVLGVEKVGLYDDFFELGGHSLLATQIVSRLHQAFQVELSLGTLLERSTVASLAEIVVQQQLEHVDETALSELLAEIEQLSPEQAELALTSASPK